MPSRKVISIGGRNAGGAPGQGKCLVLGVAPYSQYDLTLLDVIDESLQANHFPDVRIYVANLLDYDTLEQLAEDFPGVGQAAQPPMATLWDFGRQTRSAAGKQARDLAAEAIGVSSKDLAEKIFAESPRSMGSFK